MNHHFEHTGFVINDQNPFSHECLSFSIPVKFIAQRLPSLNLEQPLYRSIRCRRPGFIGVEALAVNSSMLSTSGVSANCWILTLFSGSTTDVPSTVDYLGSGRDKIAGAVPQRIAWSSKVTPMAFADSP